MWGSCLALLSAACAIFRDAVIWFDCVWLIRNRSQSNLCKHFSNIFQQIDSFFPHISVWGSSLFVAHPLPLRRRLLLPPPRLFMIIHDPSAHLHLTWDTHTHIWSAHTSRYTWDTSFMTTSTQHTHTHCMASSASHLLGSHIWSESDDTSRYTWDTSYMTPSTQRTHTHRMSTHVRHILHHQRNTSHMTTSTSHLLWAHISLDMRHILIAWQLLYVRCACGGWVQ